jgi:60 kDa SS-A/Ro ribonucleoprotein
MRKNVKAWIARITTHEGAPAALHLSVEQRLRRSVMSCLLWEKEFYESGEDIASRISSLAKQLPAEKVAAIAIEAREVHNLRHVPLLLLEALSWHQGKPLVRDTVARVVQRADEITELLAIIWGDKANANKTKTIPNMVRQGLQIAFGKFDEYRLAKYDRDNVIKLSDAIRMVRPKPADEARAALYKRVRERTLAVPDTWEVALSGGADKKETFERLLREGNLGYLALLRNLRNMVQAGVDEALVRDAILARKGARRVFPFRYVAAARAAPQFEPYLDQALCAAIDELPKLDGRTIVLIDVSGAMDWAMSGKSDMVRIDAAAALGSIVNADVRLFTFSDRVVEVPPRRGMAGVDAIKRSQSHQGTRLGEAVREINKIPHDRLIVITDEQSADRVPDPVASRAYMINVASNRNGIGYGKWTHIDGFSEGVVRYICESEKAMPQQ